jgi:hypothetical protein
MRQPMWAWLSAIRRETTPAIVGTFSLASTILTFLPALGLHRYRWISLTCLIVAFTWANVQVFKKQQATIDDLQSRLQASEEHRARLVIHPRGPARYFLARAHPNSGFDRIYIQIGLVGDREKTYFSEPMPGRAEGGFFE